MSNILKPVVLKLNGNWEPIGFQNAKQAIISMCEESSDSGTWAMNISYDINNITGEYDFDNPKEIYPVKWSDWINLPIRDYDCVIQGACRAFRAPTVTIAIDYHKMPMVEKSPNKSNIYERDGGIDQYTGKKLSRHQASIDHVTPKSKGGDNSWGNLVLTDKEINFRKGNRSNEEVGLQLIRKPKAPPKMPISFFIKEARHKDWGHFLHK